MAVRGGSEGGPETLTGSRWSAETKTKSKLSRAQRRRSPFLGYEC